MSKSARAAQSISRGFMGPSSAPFGVIGRPSWTPTARSALEAREQGISVTWSDEDPKVEEVTITPRPVTFLEPIQMAPVYVHQFVERVAKVRKVCRVIAEAGEDGHSVHVTTFVRDMDPGTRKQLYDVEAETTLKNEDVIFDFHVRREEEVSGSPTPIAGEFFYYTIWDNLNANSGGSSEAGRS